MITFNYDSNTYDPSAPIIEVVVRNPRTGKETLPIRALVDTGADATFIPMTYLRQLRMPIKSKGTIRSHWGEPRSINVYLVYLVIRNVVIQVPTAIGDNQGEEIVLGRDALNQLRIVLNGWAEVVEVDDDL